MESEIPRRVLSADQIFKTAQSFFKKSASSSLILLSATLIAIIWANSRFDQSYFDLWQMDLTISLGRYHFTQSLLHWIDDGLMTIFFFTVGLEIKREILVGELASPKKALLPVTAALGGMLFPAAIYLIFNYGRPGHEGWGIPMATDIAFSLGAIAVFGRKLPVGLRVFLSAFAIADDLGAVLVIALFYTKQIAWQYLLLDLPVLLAVFVANLLWIRWTPIYAILGLLTWLAILASGVHPTVAGIVIAMFIPARAKYDTDRFVQKVHEITGKFECLEQSCGYTILLNRDHLDAVRDLEMACHEVETPLQRLEHGLYPMVTFFILPLFALANAGLRILDLNIMDTLAHPITLGITMGLLVGKPLGIVVFSYLSAKAGFVSLPDDVRWSHILGAGFLGGIGFTMSLFISTLSFHASDPADYSKLGILIGSLLSAILGLTYLWWVSRAERIRMNMKN
jgi:Na+:H+ antiporter, NhaA family